jgi:DNA helicase-2/ATP-dependent DNA helicase PcrA
MDDLLAAADAYDRVMAEKSKPGTKVHERNLQSAQKFREFIDIFQAYQEMLAATGRYDYDDMILRVIRALTEDDTLLASLQERYQYLLVDEFQDTNGAQYKLISQLTTYRDLPHEPNVFVVGDDDQAIYRFQGANLQNMLSFHARFPHAPVIALTTSYRSTQTILDAAQALIARNTDRLVGRVPGLEKILQSAMDDAGVPVTLLRPPSDAAEPWYIAEILEARIAAGQAAESMAVLTRTNEELFLLLDVLRARRIPVVISGTDDLLEHPLVRQVVTILRAIDEQTNDRLLQALSCDCFGVHPADLARVTLQARDAKVSPADTLVRLTDEAASAYHNLPSLLHARDVLLTFRQKAAVRTLIETVDYVLREAGIAPHPQSAADDINPRDLAAVEAFFRYVRERSIQHPGLTIRQFMDDISFYDEGVVRLSYSIPHLTEAGVNIMTAHQSKGLEFQTVIIMHFREGHWEKRRKPPSVSIPEDLLFGWSSETTADEAFQDDRRLAFVSCTRAKKEIILICPTTIAVGEKTKDISPSAFSADMGNMTEEHVNLEQPEQASLLLHPHAPLPDAALETYLRERLQSFALSATALNRFLTDPHEFLRIDLLGQPEEFDEGSIRRLGYGNAVHWALRQWADARLKGKDMSAEQFVSAFERYLHEKTILTDQQRSDLLALGSQALPQYYAQRLQSSSPFLYGVERDVRARIDDIPLKGKIDRIDIASPTSARATIIDYKAGKAKTESEIRGSIEEGRVSRTDTGAHFRQLAFYAVLLEAAEPLLEPEAFVLEYIGERGEHPVSRSFVVSDAEKKDLRSLIGDVWTKVTALDFTPL